jgi:hypothetical protein
MNFMYNTSEEYRKCIRDFFKMDIEKIVKSGNLDHLDGEDLDEQLYDDDAMSKGLDHIYSITKDDPRIVELYRLAAGVMFSENLEIGMTVLFSYDYFATFGKYLAIEYLEPLSRSKEKGAEGPNELYMILYNKLSK